MIPMRSRLKRTAARIADRCVTAIASAVWRGNGAATIPASPRVLVIRCDHIGDAAMATPVLAALRDALHPETLDVLAGPWAAPVFEAHPAVDRVLVFATPWWSRARGVGVISCVLQWLGVPGLIRRIRAGHYDVGIDLRGDLRQIVFYLGMGGMPVRVGTDRTGGRGVLTHAWPFDPLRHDVEKNFEIAALACAATGGVRRAPTAERGALLTGFPTGIPDALAGMLSAEAAARGFVVLAMQGSAPNRGWPSDHAATLASAIGEMGMSVVLVGSKADVPHADAIVRAVTHHVVDLTGRTSVEELPRICKSALATIAVDSGPMHLASAAGGPVIGLFGPGDPRTCGPWSSQSAVVSEGAPCGCRNPTCDFTSGPGRCMRAIEPSAVLAALKQVLDR